MKKPKILLLSGYDAPSHQYWRRCLEKNLTMFEWFQVVLAPRHFSWRIRGNAFNFLSKNQSLLEKEYDLLIVTSMVDLNNLRGLVPKLASIPTILYFHENQFAYPQADGDKNEKQNLLNAQITSLFSCYSADKILFNSNFNLNSFFKGVDSLVKRLPDGVSNKDIERLKSKSIVLSVPITCKQQDRAVLHVESKNEKAKIKILWNHRWEFDKQPEVFFKAISQIKEKGVSFELYVLGQSFRNIPACFENAKKEFCQEIKIFGFQNRQEYDRILKMADFVVSSASHDFQGLSMLEAIFNGCIPIAPNRVAYPEYIDRHFLYQTHDLKNQQNSNTSKESLLEREASYLSEKILEVVASNTFTQKKNELINNCQSMAVGYSVNHLIPSYKNEILKLID